MDTKICLGFLHGKECPNSKDFETVNYNLIMVIIVGFIANLTKKVVNFGTALETTFLLRELPQNRQKSSDYYVVDSFKIARLCGFQNTRIF